MYLLHQQNGNKYKIYCKIDQFQTSYNVNMWHALTNGRLGSNKIYFKLILSKYILLSCDLLHLSMIYYVNVHFGM